MSTNMVEQTSSGTWSYLQSMETWTDAVFELLAHVAEKADGANVRSRLIGARDDAESLRDLLHAANGRHDPNPAAHATIESICSLWDANQPYFERVAAEVDPAFYAAWEARTATARAQRHEPPPTAA